jgi:hypothetical protein
VRKWILLLNKRKISNKLVIGRALLKTDKKTGKYWITANSEWLDRLDLLPNENLNLPVHLFKDGTEIEIRGEYEPSITKS